MPSDDVLLSDAETIAADMADQRVMDRMVGYFELSSVSMIHEENDREHSPISRFRYAIDLISLILFGILT